MFLTAENINNISIMPSSCFRIENEGIVQHVHCISGVDEEDIKKKVLAAFVFSVQNGMRGEIAPTITRHNYYTLISLTGLCDKEEEEFWLKGESDEYSNFLMNLLQKKIANDELKKTVLHP